MAFIASWIRKTKQLLDGHEKKQIKTLTLIAIEFSQITLSSMSQFSINMCAVAFFLPLPISVCSWTSQNFWFYVTGREKNMQSSPCFWSWTASPSTFYLSSPQNWPRTTCLVMTDMNRDWTHVQLYNNCRLRFPLRCLCILPSYNKKTALGVWPLTCLFCLKNLCSNIPF